MTDKEQIWRRIAEMETPGFFITADIMCEGSSELDGLEVFYQREDNTNTARDYRAEIYFSGRGVASLSHLFSYQLRCR